MTKAKHGQPIIAREGDQLVEMNPKPQSSQAEYLQNFRVKHGQERLDKRSAQGHSGQPKKSGHGGKFTWDGSLDEASLDGGPAALDEKDPNYIDEEEVAEVPKVDNTPHQPLEVKVSERA